MPRLAALSHAAEDALADCRAGRRDPDGPLVTAVLAIIDRIAAMVDAGLKKTGYEEVGLLSLSSADHSEIADIARNVAGDAAEVESITKPGAEIHNYQPTPGDIRRSTRIPDDRPYAGWLYGSVGVVARTVQLRWPLMVSPSASTP